MDPSYLRSGSSPVKFPLIGKGETTPIFKKRKKEETQGTKGQSVSPLCLAR